MQWNILIPVAALGRWDFKPEFTELQSEKLAAEPMIAGPVSIFLGGESGQSYSQNLTVTIKEKDTEKEAIASM